VTYPLDADQQKLIDDFKYHQPTQDQIDRISNVRRALSHAAEIILLNTEKCADQTAAVRWVNMGMMTANKAIVCERPKAAQAPDTLRSDGDGQAPR
jgi:hypothetical protein